MAGRNGQVARIYAILDLLDGAPQGLTVVEIQARAQDRGHDASKRTIYRDLEALAAAGFALFPQGNAEDTNATRWKLERLTKVNDHFVLGARELLALYLARGALVPLKDTPFYEDLESVFKKIEGRIGTKGQNYFSELSSEIHFDPGPRWGLGLDPDVLETVRACCAEKQILSVQYASANKGEKRQRRLGPQFLYFAKGSLYLVAEDLEEQKIKVFSLPRMSDAQMLEETYDGKEQDPEEVFKDSIGIFRGDSPVGIRLEFTRGVAAYVRERRWHPSQSVIAKADGTIILSLEASITPELCQWILGFGAEVRVVEPGDLQRKITQSAKRIVALYDKKAA